MVQAIPYENLGHIPDRDDIRAVLDNEVSLLIERLLWEGNITGAIAYGSVPRDEHSETSDLDILVRYVKIDALAKLRKTRKNVFDNKHIIIEFSTFHDRMAMSPFHRDSFSYLDHIRANLDEKIIFGENPMARFVEPFGFMRSDNRAVYAMDMGTLFDMMVRRYIKAYDSPSWYDYFLTGCLEKPLHFVREAVQLIYNSLPDVPEDSNRKYDKNSELLDIFFREIGDDSGIVDKLIHLEQATSDYKDYIRMLREEDIIPSDENYGKQLREIEETFPLLHDFMIETSMKLSERYFSEDIRQQLIRSHRTRSV